MIVESKATGGEKNGVPDDTVAKLTKTNGDTRQMSNAWIRKNIEKMDLSDADKNAILNGLDDPQKVKKIYAQTDANGTTYHEIKGVDKNGNRNPKEARVSGEVWNP